MDVGKKLILLLLLVSFSLIALKVSVYSPLGAGIYSGNTSATNPEGTIRFTMAATILVTLIDPPDNTIFTVTGATKNVNFTCNVTNLTGAVNVTQVRLYTDISGAFVITNVTNVSGLPPHTVTFNVSNIPLGTYIWNCEGVTSTGLTKRAPNDFTFIIRQPPPTPTPGGGGGGAGRWYPPEIEEIIALEEPDFIDICMRPLDDLESWWTFDENTIDWWDESREGIPQGTLKFIKGVDLAAIELDGLMDYLIITPDDTYNEFTEGTIAGWFNYRAKNDYSGIFSYASPSRSPSAKLMQLYIDPLGNLEFAYKDNDGYRIVQPEKKIDFRNHAKKWVHFALTYEEGIYQWYVNGVPYGSKTVDLLGAPGYWFSDLAGEESLTSTIGALIGSEARGFFKKGLDEFQIYNRALTPMECLAIASRRQCKYKCGDEIIQEFLAEECDDGNMVSGDGCSAECFIEYCGDGIVQPGLGEDCEPPFSANCDENCNLIIAEEVSLEKPSVYLPGADKSWLPVLLLAVGLLAIAIIVFFYYKNSHKGKKTEHIKKISVRKKRKK